MVDDDELASDDTTDRMQRRSRIEERKMKRAKEAEKRQKEKDRVLERAKQIEQETAERTRLRLQDNTRQCQAFGEQLGYDCMVQEEVDDTKNALKKSKEALFAIQVITGFLIVLTAALLLQLWWQSDPYQSQRKMKIQTSPPKPKQSEVKEEEKQPEQTDLYKGDELDLVILNELLEVEMPQTENQNLIDLRNQIFECRKNHKVLLDKYQAM